ncbi:MAG: glycosyl transferase [Frankiales bacterium]|jgi:ADP-heptose:LPS heptosyltransferase|nr:glycosyl transferase [Frankiales bacterium]
MTVLVTRLDSDGDVLLAGPAVRAVAASGERVVLLVGPRGASAGRLLPGVDEVVVWSCPWIEADPPPVDPASVDGLVSLVRERGVERALVLTSFHQSALPLALLLRLAGVRWIGAHSADYPGSLLDLRLQLPDTGLHEAQRQLRLAETAGFLLPAGDLGALAVREPLPDTRALTGGPPYVVVHPGASVPSRAPVPSWTAELVEALHADGHRVVVTGGPDERALTRDVAGSRGRDLGGATDLAQLGDVLARAECVVVGNTGPSHLAAAVATPVVSLFAPVVPAERWRPYRVPHVLLGDQHAGCASSRARTCPVPGHPCLQGVPVAAAAAAVRGLVSPAVLRPVEVSA